MHQFFIIFLHLYFTNNFSYGEFSLLSTVQKFGIFMQSELSTFSFFNFHSAFILVNITLLEELVNINSYFLLTSNTSFIKYNNA